MVRFEEKLSKEKHKNVLLGKDKTFPRHIAINMLPYRRIPNAAAMLGQIVENVKEESRFRRLAALSLWRLNTPESRRYLLSVAIKVKDPGTLTAIVKSLGRVGDKEALSTILKIRDKATGLLKEQASFAASLLSYRLNIRGNDLPKPSRFLERPSVPLGRIEFAQLPPTEAAGFLENIASEPFGISFSEKTLLQFKQFKRGLLAFNAELQKEGAIETLKSKKTLMGIMASKDMEEGRYHASYLILTSPTDQIGKIDFFVTRLTGEIAWAGAITSTEPSSAQFKVQTVRSLGIVPVEIDGIVYADGRIKITSAYITNQVAEKRHPTPL